MGMSESLIFWCPGGDPEHSQNVIGSKFDQDPSSCFHEDLSSSICVILLANRQTEK